MFVYLLYTLCHCSTWVLVFQLPSYSQSTIPATAVTIPTLLYVRERGCYPEYIFMIPATMVATANLLHGREGGCRIPRVHALSLEVITPGNLIY